MKNWKEKIFACAGGKWKSRPTSCVITLPNGSPNAAKRYTYGTKGLHHKKKNYFDFLCNPNVMLFGTTYFSDKKAKIN